LTPSIGDDVVVDEKRTKAFSDQANPEIGQGGLVSADSVHEACRM
jgi:hypothetical protein